MSTNSTSSNSEQIISEQLMAMLETRAQKAFPGAAQSGLRRECLSVLLAIAQGSSVTNNQLDSFLARDNHERICAVADCGQRFKRRDRSRDHIRVHLDYRPYGCDGRCGKPGCRARFHAASALRTHQGQCEYKCPHCSATVLLHNRSRHTKTRRCRNAVATNATPGTNSEAD